MPGGGCRSEVLCMAWWWALECLGALAEPGFSWAEQGGAVTLSARASLCGGASGVVAEPWRREGHALRVEDRGAIAAQGWGEEPRRGSEGDAKHLLSSPTLCTVDRKPLGRARSQR